MVLLAPMAGITDVVFRRLCRRFGAAIVYSEFLSSDGLILNTMSQEHKLALADDEHPVAYQLFGARVQTFGAAARMLAAFHPDLLDLNFGCPVRKVTGKNGGASVLRDLDLLAEIVRATVDAVDLPVTVKMRAGWDSETLVFCEAAARAVEAGAQAVTLHARTRADGAWGPKYAGAANWDYISELKKSLTSVPIIGNGDVVSPETAKAMLDLTGCDAVMVGRAALGRPWIFAEINHYLATGETLPEPAIADCLAVAWQHLLEQIRVTPESPAIVIRSMRKQLAAYVKGWAGSHELRSRLMHLESENAIRALLSDYLESHPEWSRREGDAWLDRYLPLDRDWMPRMQAMVA